MNGPICVSVSVCVACFMQSILVFLSIVFRDFSSFVLHNFADNIRNNFVDLIDGAILSFV